MMPSPLPRIMVLHDRLAVLTTVAALHLAVLGAAGLDWRAPAPPKPEGGHEVEVVSLDALGLESAEQAMPSALPSAEQAAPPAASQPDAPAPALAEPATPPLPERVSGAGAPRPAPPEDPAPNKTATEPAPPERPETAAQDAAAAAARDAAAAKTHDMLVQYAVLVAQAINRKKFYPAAAQAERNSGVVEVAFRLDAAGAVIDATVARTSGSPALDSAALQMVAAADLPQPPNGPFRGRIAIDFRIRN